MDQRERYQEDAESFRIAALASQARIWTAMPCVVKQYPSASGLGRMILDAQPTINGLARDNSGATVSIQMPVLLDCPILWQGGGGVTSTFPIEANDECLVIIASRCIDAWWQQGFKPGPAMNPPDLRMHNLSDGFALVGLRSLPREFEVDMANACLITDDGETFIKLNPTSKAISAQASGGINLNGCTIDANGNFNSPATITGATDVVTGSISLKTHKTTGVQPGTGLSSVPQ